MNIVLKTSWLIFPWWAKDIARLFLFTIIRLQIILYNALYQETHIFRLLPIFPAWSGIMVIWEVKKPASTF
ncbi:MAG: hypothetical protein LBB61_00555, partial [Treponema sp.]|nr:hypothetical protein [Treponema sp.]